MIKMINYELAKELKDNGFPYGYEIYDTGVCIIREYHSEEAPAIAVPTLSELIDACIDINHDFTFHLENTKDNAKWWAEMRGFGTLIAQAEGSTSEIALALLWLALNGHK